MAKIVTCQDVPDYGQLIRQRRITRGLTLCELSRILGVSDSSLSRWENGKRTPSIKRFDSIMKALDSEILVIGSELIPVEDVQPSTDGLDGDGIRLDDLEGSV